MSDPPQAEHRRERVIFLGRVQGVGFRALVSEVAVGRPIAGWVRNEPDGTVCMLVEGVSGDLDALIETIQDRREPDLDGVHREIIPPEAVNGGDSGLLKGFRIKFNPLPDR
ncbi:MAG: acylphosphatase [Phycisphaerae bacterium]|nr:acylphosphatase [Phycisphaerae bacterium]